MKLIILSSTNVRDLETQAEAFNIQQVGSLSVSNGQFFLTLIGEPKVTPQVEPEKPTVSKSTEKRIAAQKGK